MTTYLAGAMKFLIKFLTGKEEGAALAEYSQLLALISFVCLVALSAMGGLIKKWFFVMAGTI